MVKLRRLLKYTSGWIARGTLEYPVVVRAPGESNVVLGYPGVPV